MTAEEREARPSEYRDPANRPASAGDPVAARPVGNRARPHDIGDGGRDPAWGWIAGVIAVLVVLGLAAIFLFDRGERGPGVASDEPVGATVGVIGTDMATFEGRPVAVTGRVVNMLGRRVFVLSGLGNQAATGLPGAEAIPGNGVLVVSPRPLEPLVANNLVQVVGTVRRFDQRTIEEELGVELVGAPGTIFAQWAGRPVIVATAVAPAG